MTETRVALRLKSDFLKACGAWNCVKVKEYLDKGEDVNVIEGGHFALKYAAGPRKNKGGKRSSGLQLLEELLRSPKIDVNIKDDEGKTAFMWACINGSLEVAKRMLNIRGLDFNHRDHQGNSAFMLSCIKGRTEIVDMLLKCHKLDFNIRDNTGRNALMLSCHGGWTSIVEKLLANPTIDINCRDVNGNSALTFAWGHGWQAGWQKEKRDIAAMLLRTDGLIVHGSDVFVQRMLLTSCFRGYTDISRMLLALPGIQVNYADLDGQTALMKSCDNTSYSVTKMLLEHPDIDVNLRDNNKGQTALMKSCMQHGIDMDQSKVKTVKMLLDFPGLDANCQDNQGNTAVMHAVLHYNSADTIKVFAEHGGINWNIKNKRGLDVFTMALNKSNVIQSLLDIPSLKPDVPLLRKMKVYEKAVTHCHQFVANKILSSGATYSTGIFNVGNLYSFAFANGMKNIASVLIPDHDAAVESCRLIIAGKMSSDDSLHPQHNMTALVYALNKGLDNLALVLASGVKVTDILLMCKIFQFEEEKLRLEAEAEEETMEDSIPRKRSKLE